MITQDEAITAHYVVENLHWIVPQHRIKLKMSQRGLARELKLSQGTIQRLEAGKVVSHYAIQAVLRWMASDARN